MRPVPSRRRRLLWALVSVSIGTGAACDRATEPSSAYVTPVPRTLVTGTVFERTATGRFPVPFATVNAISQGTNLQVGRGTAGVDGRFSVSGTDVDGDAIFVFGGFGGFRQPCAAPTTVGGTRDIDLVADPTLSGLNLPADLVEPVTLTGVISEFLDDPTGTTQPAVGAFVEVSPGTGTQADTGWYVAETLTDVNGAYELCGLPSGVYVAQAGLFAFRGASPLRIGPVSVVTLDLLIAQFFSGPAAASRSPAPAVPPRGASRPSRWVRR